MKKVPFIFLLIFLFSAVSGKNGGPRTRSALFLRKKQKKRLKQKKIIMIFSRYFNRWPDPSGVRLLATLYSTITATRADYIHATRAIYA